MSESRHGEHDRTYQGHAPAAMEVNEYSDGRVRFAITAAGRTLAIALSPSEVDTLLVNLATIRGRHPSRQ